VEYTSGTSSWSRALYRAASVLVPGLGPGGARSRRRAWAVLVPLVAALAGLLFTTSATTAAGTQLRDDRRPELNSLIAQRKRDVDAAGATASTLRDAVARDTRELAGSDQRVADQQSRAEDQQTTAGLTEMRGPGLTVRLDDAPRRPDGTRPAGARADDLVVHQQDVQAVVNALWAGSAEAMTIMKVRVISTSAVRCVGNTLLLDGRVYSPPFEITAIGDPGRLQRALDGSEAVHLFRQAATDFGLGYQIRVESEVTVPAYDGSVALRSARVAD
jgi:uncharacterized protein YlxW (UPF0749 family)